MKRFFAVFLSVLLLLSFASCMGNKKSGGGNSLNNSESSFNNTVSSAQILNLFAKAEEAYGYFTSYSNIETGETDTEINGDIYRAVKNDNFCSVNTLKQYLLEIFDENITDQLLNKQTEKGNPYFLDTDHDLYSLSDSFGMFRYEINDKKYNIKQTSENELILTVVITYTSSDGTYDCTKNYTVMYINGKWVFTDFKLPYDVVLDDMK